MRHCFHVEECCHYNEDPETLDLLPLCKDIRLVVYNVEEGLNQNTMTHAPCSLILGV